MTLSKKKEVFEKTREIISRYEQTGISKNSLIAELQHAQIASRMTVLEYLPEMTDPKRGNIIDLRVPEGKINPLCFPTKSNLSLVELKKKFKLVKDLLDLIEEYPALGDCFIPIPKFKELAKSNEKIEPNSGFKDTSHLYFEIINAKKTSFIDQDVSFILRSHKARQDILKELPVFLTLYLNSSKMKYSNQVKKESIKILTPTFLRTLKIFNEDYSETINVSKKAKEVIQNNIPPNSVVLIGLVKSQVMPNLQVEFLKILGRYYYTISKQFSKQMRFDSSDEQKTISKVITSFYSEQKNESDETYDIDDIEKILSLNNVFRLSEDRNITLKEAYGLGNDSLVLKLVKTFEKNNIHGDDALHIKIYYLKLFLFLELFNEKEQQILKYVIEQDQKTLETLPESNPLDLIS